MFMLAEIAIGVVFVAATLAAIAALVYLVTLTVRERHLRPGLVAPAAQAARQSLPSERKSAAARTGDVVAHHG